MKGIKKGLAILLVLCTLLSMVVMTGAGVATGTKPDDGTTTSQPFPTNIGVGHYRIPALVTSSDGTLIAAADARWGAWTQPDDCANIDTIVSHSSNNGTSWGYTFANYIADNGNSRDFQAATFIDPALAVKGDTIYMLVDLFPGQQSSSNCSLAAQLGTGFDNKGNLLLKENANATTLDYYLKDNQIYKVSDDSAVAGYTVDAYFNLSQDGKELGNLFTYSTTYFQPLMTSYLYLTTSTDNGETWSVPQLLNLKNETEKDYLVSPGRGLVTEDGTIIFPCYTYSGSKFSLIYSRDGINWTRTQDAAFNSSEGDLVQLNDGTLRYFFRHSSNTSQLYYADVDPTTYEIGYSQTVSSVSVYSDCNLSAISYSKTTADGKQVILVSCPTSNRTNGKIFTFAVETNNALTKLAEYSVNSGAYSYSSMTELSDGSIGLLYENGDSGNITYTKLTMAQIASNVSFDGDVENSDAISTKDVTLYVGQTKTVTDESGDYESSYNSNGLNTNIANVEVAGTTTEGSTITEFSMVTSPDSGGSYYISDGNGNYLTLTSSTSSFGKTTYSLTNTTNQKQATLWKAEESGGKWRFSAVANGATRYINFSNNSINAGEATTYVWYYDATGGIYGSDNQSKRLGFNYSNGSWTSVTTNSSYGNGAFYANQTITTPDVNKTDITITGVAVGTTSVVVGNTKYNITVKEAPDVLDLESTPFVGGRSGSQGIDKPITGLIITTGTSYDLNLADGYTGTVVWSSGNEAIATVDQNGTVIGVAEGETTVTATINGVNYTIPVTVLPGPTSSDCWAVDVYNTEVTNCTAYYSLNSSDLTEFPVGTQVYVEYDKTSTQIITFFATPNDGYALTYVNGTGGSYFHPVRNSDGTGYGYNTPHNDSNSTQQTGGYTYLHDQLIAYVVNNSGSRAATVDDVHSMLTDAVDKECDGAFFFSRGANNSSGIATTTTFVAERLPTVEKEVSKVNGSDYVAGETTIQVGDTITFNVTVTQYAPSSSYTGNSITYTGQKLVDNLTGATFSNQTNTTTPTLANNAVTADTTTTYEVTYKVKQDDLDTKITNTVDLSYTYQSTYSKGSFSASAQAEASVSVLSGTPDDIVIDFGLPVSVDCSRITSYDFQSGKAIYGDISINGRTATYTPTTVLEGVDTVTLTNTRGAEYTFNVYPATTVYYEEGFAVPYPNDTYVTTEGESKDLTQQTSTVGSKARYGYDDAYNSVGDSNGTAMKLAAGKGAATFTFTGTGVDVYTRSTIETGSMMIRVVDADNNLVKVISVNTVMENGETGATTGQAVWAYNVPVVSLSGLAHGTYTLQIAAVKSGSAGVSAVYIDGFRVHGTLDVVKTTAYQQDDEANPTFVELRDSVLQVGLNATADTSKKYANQIAANVMSQVYAFDSNGVNALVINPTQTGANEITVQDLLDNGPKNEIYLRKDESLVFTVNAGSAQIGLKALNAETSYTINDEAAVALKTSTDMFYSLDITSNRTITITNKGEGILSITELKLFDAGTSTASVEPLSAPALTRALMSLGYEAEPVEATATLNITVQAGGETLTTTLTATGTEGERHTFTAAEIQAAVEVLELPEGYTLDGVTFEDVTVTCGEASDVSFTAAESPAPTPVSPLQKIVQIAVKIIRKIVSWF